MIAEMRHRLFVLAMWTLAYVALMLGDWLTPNTYPLVNRAHVCAERLGISYTVEDGATESIDSFTRCVRGGSN